MLQNPIETVKKLTREKKDLFILFGVIFAFGFLMHIYMFTHKFFNYFELGNIFADMSFTQGDTIAQGRWFLPIATNLFTGFSIPAINGIVSLFYLTTSAVMIVDLLQIKSKLYSVLFGFAFVSFPGYACILAFGVNADAISMGIFLCVIAVYFYKRLRYGWILAVLCIGCGLGAYQTYLSLSIGIIYMLLFFEVYSEKIDFKTFMYKVVKAGAMLLGGFLMYYIVLQLSTVLTGVALTDYHGVDSMTSFTPKGIAKGLVYTYGYFLSYFFSTRYLYTIPRIIFNGIGALVLIGFSIARIAAHKKQNRPVSGWMLGLLLCLLPLGVNSTPFLMADRVGAGVDRYMIPSIMFVWAMLLKILDMERGNEKWQVVFQWCGVVSVVTAIATSAIICNESYHRMEAATQTTASYLNRIAMRIEEMPQWQQGMPVYFANTKGFMSEVYDVEIPAYEKMTNMPGTELSPHYNERGIAKYFRTYLHFPIKDAGEERKEQIEQSAEFRNMPAYPKEGSIDVIQDVIVVKLCESEVNS